MANHARHSSLILPKSADSTTVLHKYIVKKNKEQESLLTKIDKLSENVKSLQSLLHKSTKPSVHESPIYCHFLKEQRLENKLKYS